MNIMQQMVREWHEKFGVIINDKPTIPSEQVKILRRKLIEEEASELFDAIARDDIVEVADGIGDLLVVLFGTAISYGIDMQPVFDEIQRSNMSKLWPDGTPHYNEFGKVIKPDNYSPANIAPILEQQRQ